MKINLDAPVAELTRAIRSAQKRFKQRALFPKDCLTPNQAGELVGVSGPAVKQWIDAGKLEAAKLPNGYYAIKPESLAKTIHVWRFTK